MQIYLDVHELAGRLGLKAATIVRNAKHAPWRLPPRAQLADHRMTRWRTAEVELWLTTRGAENRIDGQTISGFSQVEQSYVRRDGRPAELTAQMSGLTT